MSTNRVTVTNPPSTTHRLIALRCAALRRRVYAAARRRSASVHVDVDIHSSQRSGSCVEFRRRNTSLSQTRSHFALESDRKKDDPEVSESFRKRKNFRLEN